MSILGVAVFGGLCFMVGVHLGGNIVGKHIVEEIIEQGFVNVGGVRYRVDQIGRKAK